MNRRKLGIYAGSFNPFTIGHNNILEKAERILGEGSIMIAIGCNPDKPSSDNFARATYLSDKISEKRSSVMVEAYTIFLHELILQKEEEGYDVVLIRGLRNGDDLSHEDNQLKFIEDIMPLNYHLNVMFIMSDEKYKHISSSAVRSLNKFREGCGDKYSY